ncbi:hypothetical protein ACGF13_08255 [Kitasatospora sp. NPDC048286]|uniref:hypothetical protein n=1 Tax=Kitasatospora sp. NPDC048286 TaxID=3364047 RepID=UPI0037214773
MQDHNIAPDDKKSKIARIYTVAGNGKTGYSGDGGDATEAEVGNPVNIATDGTGNL